MNKIKGGLADNKKPSDFDKKQLKQGQKVEMEHTDDKDEAKEIAMDHLTENGKKTDGKIKSKYYPELEKMEDKLKQKSERSEMDIKKSLGIRNEMPSSLIIQSKIDGGELVKSLENMDNSRSNRGYLMDLNKAELSINLHTGEIEGKPDYLQDTHGESWHDKAGSPADQEVVDYITKVGIIDVKHSPTHNPPEVKGPDNAYPFASPILLSEKVSGALNDIIKATPGEGSKGGKVIGHTRSGKPIYDSPNHKYHGFFTKKDHNDAINVHRKLQDELEKKAYIEKHGRAPNVDEKGNVMPHIGDTPIGFASEHHTTKDEFQKHEEHIEAHRKLGNEAQKKEMGPREQKVIGQTRSGKPVHETFTKKHTSDFSLDDHADAINHHNDAIDAKTKAFDSNARSGKVSAGYGSPALEAHGREIAKHKAEVGKHQEAINQKIAALRTNKSVDSALDDLIKSNVNEKVQKSLEGEGSRGGKVIGHTKSGKPIYEDHNHPSHKGFDMSDHMEAAVAHKKKFHEIREKGGGLSDEHRAGYNAHMDAAKGEQIKQKKNMTFKDAHSKIRDALKQHGWETTEGLKYNHATSPDKKHRLYFTAQSIHHSHQPEGRGHSMNTAHSLATDSKGLSTNTPERIHKFLDKITTARAAGHDDKPFSSFAESHPKEEKKSVNALNDLIKSSGEGSKGGKVIGHTKSGKSIYESHSHPSHSSFSHHDHKDAAEIHQKTARSLIKEKKPDYKKISFHMSQATYHSKNLSPKDKPNINKACGPEGVDKDKYKRCVTKVKAKGGVDPYAVCTASLQGTTKKSMVYVVDKG